MCFIGAIHSFTVENYKMRVCVNQEINTNLSKLPHRELPTLLFVGAYMWSVILVWEFDPSSILLGPLPPNKYESSERLELINPFVWLFATTVDEELSIREKVKSDSAWWAKNPLSADCPWFPMPTLVENPPFKLLREERLPPPLLELPIDPTEFPFWANAAPTPCPFPVTEDKLLESELIAPNWLTSPNPSSPKFPREPIPFLYRLARISTGERSLSNIGFWSIGKLPVLIAIWAKYMPKIHMCIKKIILAFFAQYSN